MDVLGLTDYATTLALVAVLILTFYLFGRRNFSYFKELGLSGPKPVSHLGNLVQIKKLGFNNVFKYWREIYGDVYGIYFGVVPNCIVSDPEFVQEVLVKRFSNFVNRTIFEGDEISNVELPSAKDEHWKYLRTVLTPSFTSHQMRAMNAMIQTCADNLVENIDTLAENGEVTEVKKLFSAYTIDAISATGFGIRVNSQKDPDDPLVTKAKDIFKFTFFQPLIFLTVVLPSSVKLIVKFGLTRFIIGNQMFFRTFCKKLIEERKKIQVDLHKKEATIDYTGISAIDEMDSNSATDPDGFLVVLLKQRFLNYGS
eukprot:XP_014790877.1 PREDICTED: cytochrome P450 3A9-like [Octopus bimaculoides]